MTESRAAVTATAPLVWGPPAQAGPGTAHPQRPLSPFDRLARSLLRFAIGAAIAITVAVLLRTYIVQPFYIPSASMETTLHGCPGCDDDHIVVSKLSDRADDVSRRDIVVFDRPKNFQTDEKVLIKRVIGLPGEQVSLRDGDVYVDGRKLDEPYLDKACGPDPSRPLTGTSSWQVGPGQIFVMGDNRCNSSDSRLFGPVAESTIVGRAVAIIWPITRVRVL